jgi:hypothetical protein
MLLELSITLNIILLSFIIYYYFKNRYVKKPYQNYPVKDIYEPISNSARARRARSP